MLLSDPNQVVLSDTISRQVIKLITPIERKRRLKFGIDNLEKKINSSSPHAFPDNVPHSHFVGFLRSCRLRYPVISPPAPHAGVRLALFEVTGPGLMSTPQISSTTTEAGRMPPPNYLA